MPYTSPYLQPAKRIRSSNAGQARGAGSLSANKNMLPSSPPSNDDFLGEFDYAAAISGAFGLAGQYAGMVNQELGLEQAPGLQLSPTGEPVYNLGGAYNSAFGATPQDATTGEVLGATGQGAAAGFAAGGPIGAAVGGVIGLGTSLVGGRRRRNKQRDEKNKALAQVRQKQEGFNQASQSFEEEQLALQSYQDRSDISDRMYNLYKI